MPQYEEAEAWVRAKGIRLPALRREPRVVDYPGCETDPNNKIDGLLELIETAKPESVIEIGCHRGVSTEAFLLTCKRVVAIDPWDGVIWHNAYDAFVARCGDYPNLQVVRGRSPDALAVFGREFDLCYIDAMHDYAPVLADIAACRRVVKLDGWIAGHDYHSDQVRRAIADSFAAKPTVFADNSWLLRNE